MLSAWATPCTGIQHVVPSPISQIGRAGTSEWLVGNLRPEMHSWDSTTSPQHWGNQAMLPGTPGAQSDQAHPQPSHLGMPLTSLSHRNVTAVGGLRSPRADSWYLSPWGSTPCLGTPQFSPHLRQTHPPHRLSGSRTRTSLTPLRTPTS